MNENEEIAVAFTSNFVAYAERWKYVSWQIKSGLELSLSD